MRTADRAKRWCLISDHRWGTCAPNLTSHGIPNASQTWLKVHNGEWKRKKATWHFCESCSEIGVHSSLIENNRVSVIVKSFPGLFSSRKTNRSNKMVGKFWTVEAAIKAETSKQDRVFKMRDAFWSPPTKRNQEAKSDQGEGETNRNWSADRFNQCLNLWQKINKISSAAQEDQLLNSGHVHWKWKCFGMDTHHNMPDMLWKVSLLTNQQEPLCVSHMCHSQTLT